MDDADLDSLIKILSRNSQATAAAASATAVAEAIRAAAESLRSYSSACHTQQEFAARLVALASAARETATAEAVHNQAGGDSARQIAAKLYSSAARGDTAAIDEAIERLTEVSDSEGRLASAVFDWLPSTVLALSGIAEPRSAAHTEGDGDETQLEQVLGELTPRARDILLAMSRGGLVGEGRGLSQDAIAGKIDRDFRRGSFARPFAELRDRGLISSIGRGCLGETFLTPRGVRAAASLTDSVRKE